MTNSKSGKRYYMGSEIKRPAMVKLFSGILRLESDNSYYLVTPVEKVSQLVCFVRAEDKRKYLQNLLKEINFYSVIIFTRTKHGANRLAAEIKSSNIISDALHGNKSQAARQRTLKDFKSGKVNVLVATDIAARGIDIEGISHVINYELPNVPDDYIHRIGRPARAGASGTAPRCRSGS